MTDGGQQPETTGGQPLQETATASQAETKAPDESVLQTLKEAIDTEANKVHSTLRKDLDAHGKYLKLAGYELGQRDSRISKLQEDYDSLVAKGEGGADMVKLRKQAEDRLNTALKKETDNAWKEAELGENARLLQETLISGLIDKLATAKEGDPELRKSLIANIKSFNPKTPEDVERIAGLIVVKPPVNTPEAKVIGGGGANPSDEQFQKEYSEGKHILPADHKRAKQINDRILKGG